MISQSINQRSMLSDNLVSAEVVTMDGTLIQVSEAGANINVANGVRVSLGG